MSQSLLQMGQVVTAEDIFTGFHFTPPPLPPLYKDRLVPRLLSDCKPKNKMKCVTSQGKGAGGDVSEYFKLS